MRDYPVGIVVPGDFLHNRVEKAILLMRLTF